MHDTVNCDEKGCSAWILPEDTYHCEPCDVRVCEDCWNLHLGAILKEEL